MVPRLFYKNMKKILLCLFLVMTTNVVVADGVVVDGMMLNADVVVDGISYDVDISTMEAKVVRGNYAFRDIVIPETFSYNGRSFKVTAIGNSAFRNIYGLPHEPAYVSSLVIPHTVKIIESEAFQGKTKLKNLILPNSIMVVENRNVFEVSDSIIIEDSNTPLLFNDVKDDCVQGVFSTKYIYIGRELNNCVLGACPSIETVEYGDIPKHVLSFGSIRGGYEMTSLKCVILGKNIEDIFDTIGNFYGHVYNICPLLETIIARMEYPMGYDDYNPHFENDQYMNIKVYVPKGTKGRYETTEGWKSFFNIEEAEVYPVQVVANNYNRKYGEENPYFDYYTTGSQLDGHPLLTCLATEYSPVGNYPITVDKGTVKNVCVKFTNGVLRVDRAPLEVKVGTYTKKQGEENPDFVVEYEGFQNNESKDVLKRQPDVICIATKNSKPGEYPIIVRDAEADNYDISYTNGTLIIEEPSGISEINMCDKVCQYYTIQGTKITSPQRKGLYIAGGKKVSLGN